MLYSRTWQGCLLHMKAVLSTQSGARGLNALTQRLRFGSGDVVLQLPSRPLALRLRPTLPPGPRVNSGLPPAYAV